MGDKVMIRAGGAVEPSPDPPPDPPPSGTPTYITSRTAVYQMPATTRPAYNASYVDPVFGGTVTRISDLSQMYPNATNRDGMIYEYPSAVPISNNRQYVALAGRAGSSSGFLAVYRISDGVRMTNWLSSGSGNEAGLRFDPTDDNVLYYKNNVRQFCRINLPSGTVTPLYRFTRADGTQYDYTDPRTIGDLSFDGRWHSAHCYNYQSPLPTEWIMYDKLNAVIHKRIRAPHYTAGLHALPYSGGCIAMGDAGTNDSRQYDNDFNYVRIVQRHTSHGTVAMGSDGNEWYIYNAQTGAQLAWQGWGGYTACNLTTGAAHLIPGSGIYPQAAYHVSGNVSYSHPGWIVASHYSTVLPSPFTRPGEHEVWMWNFHTGDVKRIAHTHNDPEDISAGVGKDYWSETQAGSSWDGNTIVFKSNWRCTYPQEVYPNRQILTYMVTGNFW